MPQASFSGALLVHVHVQVLSGVGGGGPIATALGSRGTGEVV